MSDTSALKTKVLCERPALSCLWPKAAGWSLSSSVSAIDLVNPHTGKYLKTVPYAQAEDVASATRSASITFQNQDVTTLFETRLDLLGRLSDKIEQKRDLFVQAIHLEMGSPVEFAQDKQVEAALNHLRVILKQGHLARSKTSPDDTIRYSPIGVAALITPWNWPLNQVALKVGAALASGCTMVLKPSENALLSAMLFAQCMEEAGAEPGVFNLVLGDGTVGDMLVRDPLVDIVSFTGSTRAGRQIAQTAGTDLKPTLLELGGKSANILFEDCNTDLAVKQGIAHCFRNTGQSCNAASRMLVHRSIYDAVVEQAKVEANLYHYDQNDPSPYLLGPLVNATQKTRVENHIREAIDSGAKLVVGGLEKPSHVSDGYTVAPTVFRDVEPTMPLFQNEVFGPVLSITPFDDEEEAIELANKSDYGLAAYIQTSDNARASRVADRLNVGMVQVNGKSREDGAPFGGTKNSGYGREAGLFGIRSFQYIKSVTL